MMARAITLDIDPALGGQYSINVPLHLNLGPVLLQIELVQLLLQGLLCIFLILSFLGILSLLNSLHILHQIRKLLDCNFLHDFLLQINFLFQLFLQEAHLPLSI